MLYTRTNQPARRGTPWPRRHPLGPSRARTRSRPRPAARAGRRCTRTTRCSTRRAASTDENRFWFWNSMHFPVPMPAFDVICIDSPYQAVGAWQNRVFAVPPAMGIDYRCVNGYIYISGNPVTDPEKIAERAEFFQRRAGYYFENWDELYAKWRTKMEALIAEITELEVPDLPEYEPRRGRSSGPSATRPSTRCSTPTSARCARRPDVAAPLRVPAARLRRLRDVRRLLQGPSARHPRPAHRPDGRGHRRAPVPAGRRAAPAGASWRSTPASTPRSSRAARRPRSTPSWRRATPAARGWRSWRRSRTRGSTWPPATASTTTTAAGWTTRAIPYASLIGHIERAARGRADRAPDRGDRARARAAGRGVRGAARRGARADRSTSCWACRARCSRTSRSTSSSATTGS